MAAQSDSVQELETLLQAIEGHPSTKDIFLLRKPTKRNPQFRVSGVDPNILPAELSTTINTQNEGLDITPENFSHRNTFKEKSCNMTHIFEMMAMVGRQTTEIEVLKAKLEERGKVFPYADAPMGGVGEGTRAAPLPAAQPAAPEPGGTGPTVTGRPKHALLIYLRTPSTNASNDIKVMLKKYFNPHSLGLTDVSLREIRDGIAVQSNTANDLELLCAAIEEHPRTKDVFVLRKPSKRNPQFRVSGVDPDILPAELLTTVNTQNEGLEIQPNYFNHRKMLEEKSGNLKICSKSRLRSTPRSRRRPDFVWGGTCAP
ncbi:hypothetical protein HPB47_017196 [Ixodes persulcatus]|uniref:Uncharacterized protein n=1 Tax=Ixodes persulcatus TaxID=34615 RepID=A0AC60QSH0_IXOPE|nr:hypothetical protein HPB47_017196 [Ixodes persulcatus]